MFALTTQSRRATLPARRFLFQQLAVLTLLFAPGAFAADFRNPVLAGDYPDPSIIRVGKEYWATATSSEWAPLFPILRSRDMINWEQAGNVFESRPEWAVGRFWAPEIWHYKDRFYVYYVGLKRGGPLAVAVATADKPEGPWTDHGPLVAQEAGSIDPFPVVDLDGTRYLIWKEDGNSRNRPTPLWIQKLSDDGTKLVGEMKEILRNDTDWERNLVEGPYVQRHGDSWYLFYSGAGCCGKGCSYALGVARAKSLMGPWEKCPHNPLLIGTDEWKCPGHGSLVTDTAGDDWLLYHAYAASTFTYVGRQGLLDRVTWKEGWPVINGGKGPSSVASAPLLNAVQQPMVEFRDEFQGRLKPQWQWPQNLEPRTTISDGRLRLTSSGRSHDAFAASVIGVRTTIGDYVASTDVDITALKPGQSAGLAAFGDAENALGTSILNGQVVVWRRQRGRHEMLTTNVAPQSTTIHLRMAATAGHLFSFSTSADGNTWTALGGNIDVEGNYLPPWDRGIRVALLAGGPDAEARFGPVTVSARKR